MKISDVKERIARYEKDREEFVKVYNKLHSQLYNWKESERFLPRFLRSDTMTRKSAKKLSLEELTEAVKSSIGIAGEELDLSKMSPEEVEKEITGLIVSVFRNFCGTNIKYVPLFFNPTIKKKVVKGEIKYYIKDDPAGSCFITTACVEAANLPDNCYELETLRGFRDRWITKSPGGQGLIREYYEVAPGIVRAISAQPNSRDTFSRIFDKDILPAIRLIEKGDYHIALDSYKNMVLRLKSECHLG